MSEEGDLVHEESAGCRTEELPTEGTLAHEECPGCRTEKRPEEGALAYVGSFIAIAEWINEVNKEKENTFVAVMQQNKQKADSQSYYIVFQMI